RPHNQPDRRGLPRRPPSSRFSATEVLGAVPLSGFWKTRPISFARRCSGQLVTSTPPTEIMPESRSNVPATALSRVDLPEPLVPITTTKEPFSTIRSTPRSARTSLGVPGLNTFLTSWISSMGEPRLSRLEDLQQTGENKRREHKHGGHQLQVIRIKAQTQGNCHKQAEKHRPHDRPDDRHARLPGSHQRLTNDHTGQAPNHHANSHLNISEALILREESPRQRDKAVRNR